VAKARRASSLRLESSIGDDEGTWSVESTIDGEQSPSSALEQDDERADILRRMDRLDDRERMIVSLRFGLGNETPQTLKEIGRRLGVTREWVRKIELKAVSKLLADNVPPAPSGAKRRGRPRVRGLGVKAMSTPQAVKPTMDHDPMSRLSDSFQPSFTRMKERKAPRAVLARMTAVAGS
jgi:hypothetical protein